MWKIIAAVVLSAIVGASPTLAHKQSSIVGGKRIQPTKRSFDERSKEHKDRSSQDQRGPSKPSERP